MPLLRFLPPDDPRIRATVLAIADELTEDGLVLRYRVEETDDGLSGEEGTFTICSFWLVSALVEIGEVDRARQLCERLLSFASPLHLYAEEIDPQHRPAPRQLPAGVHPPGADQRGHARHPRRGARRRARLHPGPLGSGLTRTDQGRTTLAGRRPRPLACTHAAGRTRRDGRARARHPAHRDARHRAGRAGTVRGGYVHLRLAVLCPSVTSAGADRGDRARAPSRAETPGY